MAVATETKPLPVDAVEAAGLPTFDVYKGVGTAVVGDTIAVAPVSPEVAKSNSHYETKAAQAVADTQPLDELDFKYIFHLNEEQAEAARTNAEAMKPSARVAVRLPRFAFDEMVKDGRYRTAVETGYSHGANHGQDEHWMKRYITARCQAESVLGIAPEEGEPPIVYGYLDQEGGDHAERAGLYGNLALILKPEVAKRSTFTIGDSMKGNMEPVGYSLDEAVVAEEAESIKSFSQGVGQEYIEAQVLGGVSMDDVEGVVLTVDPIGKPTGKSGKIEKWQSAEEVAEFLELLSGASPDIEITIRVRCFKGFEAKFLDLADKYPQVSFVGVVDVDDIDRSTTAFKPSTTPGLRRRLEAGGVSEEAIDRQIEDSEEKWQIAQERRAELEEKLPIMWQQRGGQEVPPNLSFIVTKSSRT